MTIFSRPFLAASLERAVKTACQTLAALLLADGTGLLDTAWLPALSVAAMAAVVSVLTSVASSAATSTPGPSLTSSEVLVPDVPPRAYHGG